MKPSKQRGALFYYKGLKRLQAQSAETKFSYFKAIDDLWFHFVLGIMMGMAGFFLMILPILLISHFGIRLALSCYS